MRLRLFVDVALLRYALPGGGGGYAVPGAGAGGGYASPLGRAGIAAPIAPSYGAGTVDGAYAPAPSYVG